MPFETPFDIKKYRDDNVHYYASDTPLSDVAKDVHSRGVMQGVYPKDSVFDSWATDTGISAQIQAHEQTQVKAAKEAERQRYFQERSGPAELASSLVGGLTTNTFQVQGRALQGLSDFPVVRDYLPEGVRTGLKDFGSTIETGAKDFEEAHPFLQENPNAGVIAQVVRSVAQSIGTKLVPAAVGLAGSVIPGVGPIAGAVTGGLIGGPTTYALDKYRDVKDRTIQAGIDPQRAEEAAVKEAAWEFGGELGSDALTAGAVALTGGAGASGASTIKEGVKGLFKRGAKDFLKLAGVTATGEIGGEMATAAGQTYEENQLGLSKTTPWQAAVDVIGPTAVASAIFAILGESGVRLRNRQVMKAIEDPGVDVRKRQAAVDQVYGALQKIDPDIAETWNQTAGQAIQDGQPISMSDDLLQLKRRITNLEKIPEGKRTDAQNQNLDQYRQQFEDGIKLLPPPDNRFTGPTGTEFTMAGENQPYNTGLAETLRSPAGLPPGQEFQLEQPTLEQQTAQYDKRIKNLDDQLGMYERGLKQATGERKLRIQEHISGVKDQIAAITETRDKIVQRAQPPSLEQQVDLLKPSDIASEHGPDVVRRPDQTYPQGADYVAGQEQRPAIAVRRKDGYLQELPGMTQGDEYMLSEARSDLSSADNPVLKNVEGEGYSRLGSGNPAWFRNSGWTKAEVDRAIGAVLDKPELTPPGEGGEPTVKQRILTEKQAEIVNTILAAKREEWRQLYGEDLQAGEQTQDVASKIDVAAREAATHPGNALPEPTQAQKEAGNYKKGHVNIDGLDITIENPKGSIRRGVGAEGKPWETEMQNHYGYIKGTEGKDGDHVDVFLGDNQANGKAYIIDQIDPKTGRFDEHKVMLGFDSEQAARNAYHANYEKGWRGMGGITEMPIPEFKEWVRSGDTTKRISKAQETLNRGESELPKPSEPPSGGGGGPDDYPQNPDALTERQEVEYALRRGQSIPEDMRRAYPDLVDQYQEQRRPGGGITGKPENMESKIQEDLPYSDIPFSVGPGQEKKRLSIRQSERSKGLGDQVVMVKADVVDPFAGGQEVSADKLKAIREQVRSSGAVDAPEAVVGKDGKIGFYNGRHVARLIKDAGARGIPVSMDAASIKIARRKGLLVEAGQSTATTQETQHQVDAVAFKQAYDEAGKGRGFVRIHRIREALGWPREKFDAMLEQQHRAGNLVIHVGDPGSLTKEELANSYIMPGDGRKTFFITMTWRGKESAPQFSTKSKETDFIPNASGSINYGQIETETGRRIGRQAGPIRLQIGRHDEQGMYGLAHVMERHEAEILRAGYPSVESFIEDVASDYNSIHQGKGGALLLVKKNGQNKMAVVELMPDSSGDYYRVKTAFMPKESYFKKTRLLWERSTPAQPTPSIGPHLLQPSQENAGGRRIGAQGQSNLTESIETYRGAVNPEHIEILKRAITPLQENWSNGPAGGIQVHPFSEAPKHIQAAAERQGIADRVDGVFDPTTDTIHIFSDRVASPEQAVRIALEEAIGHRGLRGVLGKDAERILMEMWAAKMKEIKPIAGDRGIDISTREGRLSAAEEWFAHSLQADTLPQGWLNRVVRAVREWLRRAGVNLRLSDQEIADIFRRAREYNEQGGGVDGSGPIRFSVSSETTPEGMAVPGKEDVKPDDFARKYIALDSKETKLDLSKAGLRSMWDKFYARVVMAEYPVIRIAQKLGASEDVRGRLENFIRRVHARSSIAETSLMDGPYRILEDGSIERTGKSLHEVLSPLKTKQEMTDYETLRAVERVIALDRYRGEKRDQLAVQRDEMRVALREAGKNRKAYKPRELQKLKTAYRETVSEIKTIEKLLSTLPVEDARSALVRLEQQYGPNGMQRLRDISAGHRQFEENAILKPLVEIGKLSQERFDAITSAPESRYYASFMREMEDVEGQVLAGGKTPGSIKQLKGSQRKLIPSIEGTIANVANATKLLETQRLNQEFVKLREISPEGSEFIKPVKMNPQGLPPRDSIVVYKDGKTQYYRVPPDVAKAMDYYQPNEMSFVWKILSIPATTLRRGATLAADFVVRNPVRDQFTAMVYSRHGYVPFADLAKGMFHYFKQDALYKEFQAAGGEQNFFSMMDREATNLKARDLVGYERTGREKAIQFARTPLDAWLKLTEALEMGTRLGEYEKARRAGKMPVEAMGAARDLTLDFQRKGGDDVVRAMNMITAFWNANLQGVDKMGREFKNPATRTGVLTRSTLGITIPSLILWGLFHDDDRWKELPDWRKNFFWNIPVGKDGPIISIPKPFELGLIFGSLPERIMDWMYGNGPKAMKSVASAIKDGALPGIWPTAALPIIESMTNYSFFMEAPIESASDRNLPRNMRASQYTSELAKRIGGSELSPLSPKMLENWARAWTGNLGKMGLDISDYFLKDPNVQPVGKKWYEITPGIKGFISKEPIGSSGKALDRFYDNLEESTQAETGWKVLQKSSPAEAAKYRSEKSKEIQFTHQARQTSKMMSDLRKRKASVMQSTSVSSEAKRIQVDVLDRRMSDLANKFNERYEKSK